MINPTEGSFRQKQMSCDISYYSFLEFPSGIEAFFREGDEEHVAEMGLFNFKLGGVL